MSGGAPWQTRLRCLPENTTVPTSMMSHVEAAIETDRATLAAVGTNYGQEQGVAWRPWLS